MKTIEYRTANKSSWGDGPWQVEPDKKQFQDQATKLPCLIRRAGEMGHLCGYVGVSERHPLYGKKASEVDLDVHYGCTFAGAYSSGNEDESICHIVDIGESDKVWWLGFDCGHCDDISPGADAIMRSHGEAFTFPGREYRHFGFVEDQCHSLAKQLAAMDDKTKKSPE